MPSDNNGTLQVTDTFLADFANTKIQHFIDDLGTRPSMTQIVGFTGTGTSGGDATVGYTQVQVGNPKAHFNSSVQLQTDFKTFATALHTSLNTIQTAARTLIVDLKMVQAVLANGGDAANITAAEMMADLHNITLGGSAPPVTSTGNGPTGA